MQIPDHPGPTYTPTPPRAEGLWPLRSDLCTLSWLPTPPLLRLIVPLYMLGTGVPHVHPPFPEVGSIFSPTQYGTG